MSFGGVVVCFLVDFHEEVQGDIFQDCNRKAIDRYWLVEDDPSCVGGFPQRMESLAQDGVKEWPTETVTVIFNCSCPFYIGDNAVLAICGSTQALGRWDVSSGAIPLEREPYSEGLWKTKIRLPHTQIEYKYVILSKQDNQHSIVRWENRLNRNLDLIENKLAARIIQDTFDK